MTTYLRTFAVNCPHCGEEVAAKPRDLRVHLDLNFLVVEAELVAGHRCPIRDAR